MHQGLRFHRARRGGAILDLIVGSGVILVGAFVLFHVGVTFHELLHGAEQFFTS